MFSKFSGYHNDRGAARLTRRYDRRNRLRPGKILLANKMANVKRICLKVFSITDVYSVRNPLTGFMG